MAEPTFTEEQIKRYSRHLLLKEVGGRGQRKLLDSSVLIVGAGALGSPVALYLAAAGVGRLGIADSDVVELSNLQRQVLHRTPSLGKPKVESASKTLSELNPEIAIEPHATRITPSVAFELFRRYDVVIDGSDNFGTKYLVNDACVLLDKPFVIGSVLRFHGQVSTFRPHHGPCYRCLFEEAPPPGFMPSCAEAGVLGVVPAVIGSIEATEALKLLLGRGDTLVGRLLIYDALDMEFTTLAISQNPHCPSCGATPAITELRDENYPEACRLEAHP